MVRFMRSLLLLAVVPATLVACGGDDDTVSVESYATDICKAADKWFGELQKAQTGIQQDVANAGTDLGEVRDAAAGAFQDMGDATDDLVQAIDDAGTPDTKDGEKIADALKNGFEGLSDKIDSAVDKAQNIETDDPQSFQQEFQQLQSDFNNDDIANAFKPLEKFEDSDVAKEFDDNKTCQSVGG